MISYILSRILVRMSLKSIKNSQVDKKAKLVGKVTLVNSKIGKYSYVNNRCSFVNTEIGAFCSIASGCVCGGAGHPMDWFSTSPVFHSGRNVFMKNFSSHKFEPYKKTMIGNDVWIGSGVFIKAGVKIGNGAVIGMGSVVTKDVGDYEIWAGNPARKIRDRFDEEIKAKLIKSEWWKMDDASIQKLAPYSNDVNKLLEEMEKMK